MAGLGKTYLAKYVYGLHHRAFQKSSFLDDISRRCNEPVRGLLDLQKQLCNQFSKLSKIKSYDDYTSRIEYALAHKKVFLVLDDIDSIDQLDALLGCKGFHPGSKVIVTTKDVSLIEKWALFNLKVEVPPKLTKHLIEALDETDSLKLLCLHAFMSMDPKEGYEVVSKEMVKYCGGHPLALVVLGSSLRNEDVTQWKVSIELLKRETHSKITNVLRLSYDSLTYPNDKELFKHVACFFVGINRKYTETILKACGISALPGITNLINKCLLTIGPMNELNMHQLLQEMGRDVVRQESPNRPWKRSRLWDHKDSFKVLRRNRGTGILEGLRLDMEILDKEKLLGSIEFNTDAFGKMDNLKLLQLNYVHQLKGSYKKFPQELRWLCMHGSPLKFIPLDLPMENLVALDMSYSSLESFDMSYDTPQQAGKEPKLRSLKYLNLSSCKLLRNIGGFFELPALESLKLANCRGLIEVCESIEHCGELVLIDLRNCNMLINLPRTMAKLMKVKTLLLDGCYELCEYAIVLRELDSFLINLPSSLVTLSLEDCELSDASFPLDFSCLSTLKSLNLDGNPILSLPNCVRSLSKLETLSMRRCDILMTVVHPPRTLRKLFLASLEHLHNIVFVPEMSPLYLDLDPYSLAHSSFKIEGMVNIQPITRVKDEVLRSLGWINLEFVKNHQLKTSHIWRGPQNSQVQMYFEFGIFSTFYWGKEIPNWISERSKGPSISFTIPSSRNNLRGFNFCYVLTFQVQHKFVYLPTIRITNITKNHTWVYDHYIEIVDGTEESLTFLSHWMVGKNEIEDGDQLTINIIAKERVDATGIEIKECGVSLVYDDIIMEEEDSLGYYNSWKYIIGGDLSVFQSTTGEYILHNKRFKGIFSFTAFSEGKINVRILKEQMERIEQEHEQEMQEEIEKIELENEVFKQLRYQAKMQELKRVKRERAKAVQEQSESRELDMEEQIERRERERQEQIERIKQARPTQQAEMQKHIKRIEQACQALKASFGRIAGITCQIFDFLDVCRGNAKKSLENLY